MNQANRKYSNTVQLESRAGRIQQGTKFLVRAGLNHNPQLLNSKPWTSLTPEVSRPLNPRLPSLGSVAGAAANVAAANVAAQRRAARLHHDSGPDS